jgi:hypothetical protein
MLLIFADLLDFWVPRITDPIVCKSCAPHKVAKSRDFCTLFGAVTSSVVPGYSAGTVVNFAENERWGFPLGG